ncbi:hypothetical protein [uncultured Corynebacterium sp.]|uniref:hypothetical protein n=1 Tax=uncultured Corynebacterium sp. TaxID=159447 RepID=UPI0025D4B50D|nr:hypothetical protein [uncultured Corynebacterium sp.]
MPVLFTHARTSTQVDDPGGFLRDGASSGRFDLPSPDGPDDSAVAVSLRSSGAVPTGGIHALGLSTPHLLLVGVTVVLLVLALTCLVAGGPVVALVFTVFALVLGVLTLVSVQRRRVGLRTLDAAWRQGWVRFAPARVGAAWLDRVVRHGPSTGPRGDRGRNQDVRYWFRAGVEIFPTDGTEPFTVTTSPFQVLADRDGKPHGLRTAPGPLDLTEPEYCNGWTVARYIVGSPVESATVTTGLTDTQILAALEAAGIR